MCLFTFPNKSSVKARLKGIERFECGGCPECLQKKSRLWALRCGMQAKVQDGVMITLTYDTYKKDSLGNDTIYENPVDSSLRVSKSHAQRFIKRLRRYFGTNDIKYLLTAEYGKRTHRAHYHAILFGVSFDDLTFYKKSKRGNIIYKSKTLEKIWSSDKEHNGGICTVDAVNISGKIARYCTKYCAKDSGVDDTFMLFSRGIGEDELLKRFNGKSYWVDGREYSIPKQIWQKVIERRYNLFGYSKYLGRMHCIDFEKRVYNKIQEYDSFDLKIEDLKDSIQRTYSKMEKHCNKFCNFRRDYTRLKFFQIFDKYSERIERYNKLIKYYDLQKHFLKSQISSLLERFENDEIFYETAKINREYFQDIRDSDSQYQSYLAYWKNKNLVVDFNRPNEFQRILCLPNNKYWSYKFKALKAKQNQSKKIDFVPPRSNSNAFIRFYDKVSYEELPFAPLSRHYRANDTERNELVKKARLLTRKRIKKQLQIEAEKRILKYF